MATAKKSSRKSKKAIKLESFKVSKEPTPFMSFKITRQTIYWLILLVLIVALSLWVLSIQINTSNILDSIHTLNVVK
jgi:type VI protein secretion system component VasF